MTPWLDDGDVQLYHGDAIQVMRELPAGIAQTCVTSPPYWGLRDYSADGQLGLEATPGEYVERMVEVFREVWRVLRDDGTLWLNLGDSYASNPGSGHARGNLTGLAGADSPRYQETMRQSHEFFERKLGYDVKPKDLVGVPWRVAFALQADGWYLRSDIIWSKPNPMPESVSDRPTKAHEYLFLLTKQPRYFYDQEAIREDGPSYLRKAGGYTARGSGIGDGTGGQDGRRAMGFRDRDVETVGRNRRSVWTIATQPFPEAHFATYPEALVRPCILAGTSERGECSDCGAPWVRNSEQAGTVRDRWSATNAYAQEVGGTHTERTHRRIMETTGWRASCSCSSPGMIERYGPMTRPQTVLDPFIGSGTTAHVARKHGRRCIGIDLSSEYLEIAARRLAQQSLLAEESAALNDVLAVLADLHYPLCASCHAPDRDLDTSGLCFDCADAVRLT